MNDVEEIRETLKAIRNIQNEQEKLLLRRSETLVEHDRRMAEHDDRQIASYVSL